MSEKFYTTQEILELTSIAEHNLKDLLKYEFIKVHKREREGKVIKNLFSLKSLQEITVFNCLVKAGMSRDLIRSLLKLSEEKQNERSDKSIRSKSIYPDTSFH